MNDLSKVNTSRLKIDEIREDVLNTSRTNCITEIPQDINLELVDGTLTLKAGSKVYVPNGFESDGTTPKFDVVTIDSDISATSNENGQVLYCLNKDGTFLGAGLVNRYVSGTSDSLSGQTYHTWYDTSTNLIKRYGSSATTINHYNTFPICSVTCTGVISSIDQIFNGFGYIGSTVFALPGVKGLIPNGRNEDWTLRNIEFVTSRVITHTRPDTLSGSYPIMLDASSMYPLDASYNNRDNLNIRISTNSVVLMVDCGIGVHSSGVITSFTPKTTFHILDYNDKETIVGWGMPDYSATISITPPFTAPKAGLVIIEQKWTKTHAYTTVNGHRFITQLNLSDSGQQSAGAIIVNTGDVITTNVGWDSSVFIPMKGVN